MELARPYIPRLIMACALWTMVAAAPAFASTTSHFAGVYESPAPAPSDDANAPPSPLFAVSLGPDGSATVTQDCGKGAVTTFGRWVDNGGQITVTFDAVAGQPTPPPMTFSPSHDGLQAVTWDHAAWGKVVPPPLKKEESNWHAKGHHSFL